MATGGESVDSLNLCEAFPRSVGQLPGTHGVKPLQWPDYRALTGDPADDIPGIRGIGPKTAAALLADGIHLEQLRGSPRLDQPRCAATTACWDQLLTWRDLIGSTPAYPCRTT